MIKTASFLIREQDPLKQGLKHRVMYSSNGVSWIREQDPLKQGLKQIDFEASSFPLKPIREQDPLKQGLKLFAQPN